MSALDHFSASHFDWQCVAGIGTIRLNRPERKNPLTFESYAELKNLFHYVAQQDTIKTIVILPNGGNFCSGGDVHDIIGPLLDKDTKGLFQFTRLTGDLVKSMLTCGKPIIAYSILNALSSKYIEKVIVSTDSEEIAEISKHYGAEVPFIRPRNISDDHTITSKVISQLLNHFYQPLQILRYNRQHRQHPNLLIF